jgi:biofilm protein TabA
MILDVLDNAHDYCLAMNERFAKAFEFLLRPDLKDLAVGKYEIEGERVYAIVSKDTGRSKRDARLETHENYIDIQLILAGTDEMGWKPKSMCKQPSGEYDQENDVQFFADKPDVWLSTQCGVFAIFFPEDAHAPSISSGTLHKVVVKVARRRRWKCEPGAEPGSA